MRHCDTDLIMHIERYESDTFSGPDSKISPKEAQHIARKIVDRLISGQKVVIDGVLLSALLSEVRGED